MSIRSVYASNRVSRKGALKSQLNITYALTYVFTYLLTDIMLINASAVYKCSLMTLATQGKSRVRPQYYALLSPARVSISKIATPTFFVNSG